MVNNKRAAAFELDFGIQQIFDLAEHAELFEYISPVLYRNFYGACKIAF